MVAVKNASEKLVRPRKRVVAKRASRQTVTGPPQTLRPKRRTLKQDLEAKAKAAANASEVVDVKPEVQEIEELPPGPPNWQLYLDRIREMRKLRVAPVDSMWYFSLDERDKNLTPKESRFRQLLSLMLSSQTRDEVTAAAMFRLRDALKPSLSPESVLATPQDELAQLIYPVGFFRRKAEYLHRTCRILLDKFDGDIPKTIEEIKEFPGVGSKMGYLLLQTAWEITDGIGVDVHIHRLAHMWKWVPASEHPTPEKTRIELEKWLPRELWAPINPLLVGFGQTWCPSRMSAKNCQECHLNDLCPASKATKSKAA